MSLVQALIIIVLALFVAYIPFPVGMFFGFFGAFVVTPVVLVVILPMFGAVLARMAPTGRWIRVAFATLVIAAAYAFAFVESATEARHRVPPKTLFVLVPPADGPSFTMALAKLFGDRGIEAHLSQWSYADDPINYGLDATKGAVSILAYNTQMTAAACLPKGETILADHGQFLVTVQPSQPCVGAIHSAAIFEDLRHDLVAQGYDVRDKQAVCSALAEPRKR